MYENYNNQEFNFIFPADIMDYKFILSVDP